MAPAPGRRGQRQQHQHGGQVVDHVGQRGGERGDAEQGRQRGPGRHQRAQRAAEPVVHHRLDHDPEAEHEQQERRVRRPRQRGDAGAALRQSPRAEHDHAGQGGPGRVDARRRREHEAGERGGHYRQREHRDLRRAGVLDGLATSRQVGGEKPPEDDVLGADDRQPGQRHQPGEPAERQPAGRERQQVRQVRHREQQRPGVRQVRAGVQVRPGPHLQPGRGREHHRGEQHHRGVQAQHGGGHRRHREHQDEQPLRPPGRRAGQPCAAGTEQPVVVAQLREHEHRGEEADHRPEPPCLLARVVRRDRAGGDHQQAAAGTATTASGKPAAATPPSRGRRRGPPLRRPRRLRSAAFPAPFLAGADRISATSANIVWWSQCDYRNSASTSCFGHKSWRVTLHKHGLEVASSFGVSSRGKP